MIRSIFREAKQPQPIEKIDRSGDVKWGEDGLYPQFLVGLSYDNPVHGGIIDQKVKFITAGGVTTANPEAFENGRSAYDYQEIVEMVARDGEIFNGFALVYKKDISTGQWYANPIDFELIRQTESGVYFSYSDDWSKSQQSAEKTGYRHIKSIFHVDLENDTECIFYNIQRPKQRKLEKNQKTIGLTSSYYPAPGYSGAITQIMAGIEMDYYTYSETVNGYKGGTVISLLNGVPDSQDEENKIIKRIKDEATDRDTQGGITVLFADGKDRAPEISQMNGNDLDKRYIETGKESIRKIMIAHGVISPALFGVLSETLFGSKEEMTVAFKLFQDNYSKAKQTWYEEGLNWAYNRLNKAELGLKFNEYVLTLEQNVEEVNRTSAALNGMSPLVANKVLENLTVNEIRALASLQPIADGDKLPRASAEPTQFSKEQTDKIAEMFASSGSERDSFVILDSRSYTSFEDNESEYKNQFMKERFELVLTDDDRNILQMIRNGESYDAVSKAIGKGGNFLSNRLFKLAENGYLNDWEVTEKGVKASVVLSELEVMYSYEKRPDAPDLIGGKSRPFCERLMQLDRLYTREEINAISSAVERDVWSYRGGWYHNPETEKNTPSCRHQWNQVITVKR